VFADTEEAAQGLVLLLPVSKSHIDNSTRFPNVGWVFGGNEEFWDYARVTGAVADSPNTCHLLFADEHRQTRTLLPSREQLTWFSKDPAKPQGEYAVIFAQNRSESESPENVTKIKKKKQAPFVALAQG
jgi:hypothetical protein